MSLTRSLLQVVREREEAISKAQDLEVQVRDLKEQVALLRCSRERGGEEEDDEEECVECESEEDM